MEESGSILIVDDNPDNLEVLSSLLGQAGYRVRPALSGEIALRAVELSPPDLILLDVRMPGMDGYATCKRLKLSEVGRDVPVIFISALHDTEDKLDGFRAGGVDYLVKPFQADEVLARVRCHVQLRRAQRELAQITEDRLQRAAKEHRRQLEQSVYYDTLTGLPNRLLLSERMRQGMAQAQRMGCWMVVCYLDVDAFGPLNEAHGRTVGDHLLINVAECLRGGLCGGDTVARIGGDEFALVLLGIRSEEVLARMLEALQARLAEPFVSDSLTVTLSTSIGITVYPQDGVDPDTLLRHADQAMLAAKQAGGRRCQRFDPEGDKRLRERREDIGRLGAALARREFVLHYQPKVDAACGQVVGAEALIRWQHPERGLLPPGAFLPIIEGDALMVELGEWVMVEALAQMARWRGQGLDLAVSVNVAAQHLVRPDFTARLREMLAVYPDMPAGRLELEVLETSALDDIGKVGQLIEDCRVLGVGFSLDDFGTGYSSLTYLRRLPAATMKIDQSFVRGMLDDADDHAIVVGVIGLGRAFGRQVIAEGVETVAHGVALLGLGCALMQGYGVARPMAADDLPGWLRNWPDAGWQRARAKGVEGAAMRGGQ